MWEFLTRWLSSPGVGMSLGVALAALAGGLCLGAWIRGRSARRYGPAAGRGDKAFLKGVQYILSNDHDHAIEEFTKSVQLNSDTVETYVALGNLYRSKGDIDRAIRIRQSIILRPNIDPQLKLRALFDLGQDYRKGGFLNRSLNAFQKVAQQAPADVDTLREMERIYEELKDWEKAHQMRQKIARLSPGDHQHILAHHLVEMGKQAQERGDTGHARSCFGKAISTQRECVDAYLHLGDLHFSRQDYKQAIAAWKKVAQVAPHLTFLAYRRLEGAYSRMDNLKPVEDFLQECAQSNSDAFTHLALARYLHNRKDVEGALAQLSEALSLEPTFWEARRLKGEILMADGREAEALAEYASLIAHLDMPYLKFQCSQCGLQPSQLQWQCPQCRQWDTIQLIESPIRRAVQEDRAAEPAAPAMEPGDS